MREIFGEEVKKFRIEKFDGTYFEYWRMQIEDYLYGKKLYLLLIGKKSKDMSDSNWNLLIGRFWV